jgi:quercetin dioxygenase-like cupin family protein
MAAAIAGIQEPAAIPVDQEPNHKVAFKNDFIRVIDAVFPPGHVTLNHTHDVDNVAVTIATGREGTASPGTAGRAGFSKGGYSHRVTNSGPSTMRFIAVEILKADRPGVAATRLPHHTLETENDRVRIYRVRLGKNESVEPHTHNSGWIEVTITGKAGPGAFVWHKALDPSPLKVSSEDSPLEIVEIEPK